jgi:hypothetical protein
MAINLYDLVLESTHCPVAKYHSKQMVTMIDIFGKEKLLFFFRGSRTREATDSTETRGGKHNPSLAPG